MAKLTKIAYFFGISLLLLSLIRFTLWIIFSDDFSSLSLEEALLSFWTGFRIDLISIATWFSLFTLLQLLPFKFTDNHTYQKVLGYAWYFVLILILFILMSDMVYFQFVHRHIGHEITAMTDDTHIVIDMLLEYKLLVFIYILIALGLFFLFKKIIDYTPAIQSHTVFKRSTTLFLSILVLFLSIRGKVTGMSFSMSDAFVVNKTASGNLALNGFFTLYRTLSQEQKTYTFFPLYEAIETSKALLTSEKFIFVDDAYPLLRQKRKILHKQQPNVMIILLESWSAKYVDSYGHNNLNVTPYFDALAEESVVFPNFYANGQRSIEGITALLTGLPVLNHFNFLGSGLELSNLSYLGTLAKKNGYSTIAMQSSDRGSFRVDAVAKIAGFDSYYGAEDMALVGDEDADKKPHFGTWDGNMYHLLSQKLSSQKEPFLSFAFTSVTHAPYVSPGKQWEVYPHDTSNIFGYLNTLKYADEKLGHFIENAKKEPWFDNTIFIFMADHTVGFNGDNTLFKDKQLKINNRSLENMRIPLMIYAPKLYAHRVIDTIGSQADILPTLVDILEWEGTFSTLSRSLFDESATPFALLHTGATIGLVDQSGYITHTLQKRLELTGDENLEKKILSLYQSSSGLILQNIWAKRQ